jgi:hypothetical protein
MNKHILRSSAIVALVVATQVSVWAQETVGAEDSRRHRPGIEGVWTVNVTIRDCKTGDVIRSLRALNLFIHDGSLTETAVNVLRTPSVGTWRHVEGQIYASTFTFYRYKPDGTFASRAKVTRAIELSDDGGGGAFTSTDTVEDFDAKNALISTTCATETATRPE